MNVNSFMVIIALLALSACTKPMENSESVRYEKEYLLFRANINDVTLWLESGGERTMLIGPTVTRVHFGDKFIIGYNSDGPSKRIDYDKKGYFIINKDSGEVAKGMSESVTENFLNEHGVEYDLQSLPDRRSLPNTFYLNP